LKITKNKQVDVMKNHNMKKAIKILMQARAKGIVWKLILQIILDRPSAIINAWSRIDKNPELCPAKVWECSQCHKLVASAGNDGRCGRCNPTSNF